MATLATSTVKNFSVNLYTNNTMSAAEKNTALASTNFWENGSTVTVPLSLFASWSEHAAMIMIETTMPRM